MPAINSDTLLSQLSWRYATKKFDATKKISADDWSVLEQTLILSPSSYGLQLWKFYVVENPSLRTELRKHSWDQSQIVDASHLVVISSKKEVAHADVEKLINHISKVREAPTSALEGYKGIMLQNLVKTPPKNDLHHWMARQAYIALGFLLSSAALLGIDACPMEGFDATKYDEILGIGKDGHTSCVVCALGYRATDDSYASAKKVRYSSSEVMKYIK